MNNIKINYLVEYLCPTLVLTYFFIHNILFVFMGILLSLYLINLKFISSFTSSFINKLVIYKSSCKLNRTNTVTKSDYVNIISKKEECKFSLVETIEELGFIPAPEKNNDINSR